MRGTADLLISDEATETRRVRLRTNAKLNLYLNVVGLRRDGWHEVETVLHAVGLGDELEVEQLAGPGVQVEWALGDDVGGELPPPGQSTVDAAVAALVAAGASPSGARILIRKHIPIGAGLAGGSANAAGVLWVLNEVWSAGFTREELMMMAAGIGSDVPYCLDGVTALATGRGVNLTPLPTPAPMFFVLGVSDEPLLTRDVYEQWDKLEIDSTIGSAPIVLALGSGDVHAVARALHNDLEPAAFSLRPELAAKKQALSKGGALGACMTGSGPTIYGLALDQEHAADIAEEVRGTFDRTFVVSSTERCVEPEDLQDIV